MAFGIKAIKAILSENGMPLENLETAASEICGRHKTEIDSVKEERDGYKQETETLADLKNQLKEAQEKITAYEKDDYKTKYESEKAEHEKLKADVAGKETLAKKESALRNELKNKKYSDDAAKLILSKGGYTDKIELDKDGKAKNLDSIFESINSDFSMFTPRETAKTSAIENPPINAGGKKTMTKAEIMAIKDSSERQKAIKESIESGENVFRI